MSICNQHACLYSLEWYLESIFSFRAMVLVIHTKEDHFVNMNMANNAACNYRHCNSYCCEMTFLFVSTIVTHSIAVGWSNTKDSLMNNGHASLSISLTEIKGTSIDTYCTCVIHLSSFRCHDWYVCNIQGSGCLKKRKRERDHRVAYLTLLNNVHISCRKNVPLVLTLLLIMVQ